MKLEMIAEEDNAAVAEFLFRSLIKICYNLARKHGFTIHASA